MLRRTDTGFDTPLSPPEPDRPGDPNEMENPRQPQLHWRDYAKTARIYLKLSQLLTEAEVELLDFLHRGICEGVGKSARDPLAGKRRGLPLIPELLSKHGLNFSATTYKHAIARLRKAQFFVRVGTEKRRQLSAPCWWIDMFDDPVEAVKMAYQKLALLERQRVFDSEKPAAEPARSESAIALSADPECDSDGTSEILPSPLEEDDGLPF